MITRINNIAEVINLFETHSLTELGKLADEKRQELHPDTEPVTFVIDRNVNYTNVCSCKCRFCMFNRDKDNPDAYVLGYEEIKSKLDELIKVGGTQLLLQGGMNSDLPLEYYISLVKNIRKDFPNLSIHAFSPPEIDFIARNNGLSIKELLEELMRNGLSSIPGGGAELLSDEVRTKLSPNKISSAKWLEVMETAHNLGIRTTATMVFGFGEDTRHIAEHLLKIRELQDRTGGFTAFIPWTFAPAEQFMGLNSHLNNTAHDYLKTLAVSRLVLDNIPNIQVSWVTQGLDTAQVGLRFGANDFGGVMLEENVVRSAGVCNRTSVDEIVEYIHKAGFAAAQRDTYYSKLKIFSSDI
jgi:cyclic dehypoxanthinyl futalosine synthase